MELWRQVEAEGRDPLQAGTSIATYLGTDIEWVTGLLRNHRLPVEALYGYLDAYRQSIGEHLDERGQPIID